MTLALACVAEHICTGDSLADIVGRLGVADRAGLPGDLLELERAVADLRRIVVPQCSAPSPMTVRLGKPVPAFPTGSMVRYNKYAGTCGCGRRVPEGQGRAMKAENRWIVECALCFADRAKEATSGTTA